VGAPSGQRDESRRGWSYWCIWLACFVYHQYIYILIYMLHVFCQWSIFWLRIWPGCWWKNYSR
jgi:hypothetical protein